MITILYFQLKKKFLTFLINFELYFNNVLCAWSINFYNTVHYNITMINNNQKEIWI